MRYLLDTSIVSETRKMGRANRGVRRWVSSVRGGEMCVSVMVFGEIRQGVERLRPRDEFSMESRFTFRLASA